MLTDVNLWPLIGVAIIVAGFVLRFNPMLVVIVTAIGTALAAAWVIIAEGFDNPRMRCLLEGLKQDVMAGSSPSRSRLATTSGRDGGRCSPGPPRGPPRLP